MSLIASPNLDVESAPRKISQLITDSAQIHCKNGCGFYGNPGWDGFCSKCYQEHLEAQEEGEARSGSGVEERGERGLEVKSATDGEASDYVLVEKCDSFSNCGTVQPASTPSLLVTSSPAKKSGRRWIFRSSRQTPASSASAGSSKSSGSAEAERPRFHSDVSTQASSDFAEFLKTLDKKAAQDLSKEVKLFHDAFKIKAENLFLSCEDMEREIQDFYSHLQERVFSHPVYRGVSSDETTTEYLFQFVEKYLLSKLHYFVSGRLYHDCEERDLEIQNRIRSLNWVTPDHLDAPLSCCGGRGGGGCSRSGSSCSSDQSSGDSVDSGVNSVGSYSSGGPTSTASNVSSSFSSSNCHAHELTPEVGDAIDKAISAITEMDAQKSPQDKLHAILGCAAFVHEAIRASAAASKTAAAASSKTDAAANVAAANVAATNNCSISADDFLPVFLYVILQANPPMLHSNITFISRFSLPQRVREGESGYLFTTLCIAVDFILHHLNSSTLNMSERDFSRAMKGDLTHLDNALASRRKSENLKLLVNSFHILASLQQRQEKLKAEAALLRQEMQAWNQRMAEMWGKAG